MDTKSSNVTDFNMPYGRYRWKRLPFSISSAPEIIQRRMNEIIEGFEGIEVVTDDLIINTQYSSSVVEKIWKKES